MIDLLDDALKDLASSSYVDPASKLEELRAEEDRDYEKFVQSEPSSFAVDMLPEKRGEEEREILNVSFRNRGICHTGRLPSESRYNGILTESTKVGPDSFDRGTSRGQADKTTNENDLMRLVYDQDKRQECDVQLNMDYVDYFFLRQQEGWKMIVLPNDAEIETYMDDNNNPSLKGLIAFSLVTCSWGKCPGGDVREDGVNLNHVEIQVNGVKVSSTIAVQSLVFLRHDGGLYFQPNGGGRFEIDVRVLQSGSSIRFSSFVIW